MKFVIRCWLVSVFLLWGPALYAGSCRAVVVKRAVVKEAVVVEKVADVITPVVAVVEKLLVPLYSTFYHGPVPYVPPASYMSSQVGYGAPAGGYGAQPVAVPGYGPQPAQPGYGQQPSYGQGGDQALQQLAAEVARINQRLDRIVPPLPNLDLVQAVPQQQAPGQQPAPGQPPGQQPGQAPGQPPQPGRQPQPMPPAEPEGGTASGQENAPARALAMLQRHCGSCHDGGLGGSGRGGGVTLLRAGKLAPITPELLGTAIEAVAARRMPKNRPMSDAERIEMIGALVGK